MAKIAEPTGGLRQPVVAGEHLEQSYNGDLFKEYQKQKQKLQETIQQKERERNELENFVRQHSAPPLSSQVIDNRLQGDGWVFSGFLFMNLMERNKSAWVKFAF